MSQLTYDLRSGDPDAFDQLVATTFANIAVDILDSGLSGRMVAIRDGKFTHTSLPDPAMGARRIDVDRQYDIERFRPRYIGRLGFSLFLEPS